MSKFRLTKAEKESISEPYRQYVNERDPIMFIDLLCFSHYIAGQMGNKIPVDQARQTFKLWLSKHDKELATPEEGKDND